MLEMLQRWIHRKFSDPQIIILSALLLFGFLTVFLLGDMLIPVFMGGMIAYLLEGMVQRLEWCRAPRTAAVIIVFLAFMACVIVTVTGLVPLLSRQIAQFTQTLPIMLGKGQKALIEMMKEHPDIMSQAQMDYVVNIIASEVAEGAVVPAMGAEIYKAVHEYFIVKVTFPDSSGNAV